MRQGDGRTATYVLTPTDRAVRSLRRHATGRDDHYHAASVECGVVHVPGPLDGTVPAQPVKRKPGDPPWPRECACGYLFAVGDGRQVNLDRLWRRADTGELVTLHAVADRPGAPPGAVWDASSWTPADWRGPDGKSLVARCPGGLDWYVDHVSTTGGRWTRTGSMGLLTVSPSIAIGRPGDENYYHGHLQAGIFTPHLGG